MSVCAICGGCGDERPVVVAAGDWAHKECAREATGRERAAHDELAAALETWLDARAAALRAARGQR